jgi:hypothetical protein
MKKVKLVKRKLVQVECKVRAIPAVYHDTTMYNEGQEFLYKGIFKNGEAPSCLQVIGAVKIIGEKYEVRKRHVAVAEELIVEGEELLEIPNPNAVVSRKMLKEASKEATKTKAKAKEEPVLEESQSFI